MYWIIKCIVQGKQARVKNADLRHPSCTVVMQKRKSASPVLNVLMTMNVPPSLAPSIIYETLKILVPLSTRPLSSVERKITLSTGLF